MKRKMLTICKPLGLVLAVLLMILGVHCNPSLKRLQGLKVNDNCPHLTGYPASYCKVLDDCDTLRSYINLKLLKLNDAPSCGYQSAFSSEMVCCPYVPPNKNVTGAPVIDVIVRSEVRVNELATLGSYLPPTMDSIVYKCTAVILSENYVLATTSCLSRSIASRPNRVLMGVNDPRNQTGSRFETEIKASGRVYGNELVMFELHRPIRPEHLTQNVRIAQLCDATDLEGKPQLHAVAFAYDEAESTNCALFKQKVRIVDFSECNQVSNSSSNGRINIERDSHWCVVRDEALPQTNGNCSACLTPTSSVLHVERTDGSVCLAGIATPTTEECVVNSNPLYYTNFVNDAVSNFITSIILPYNGMKFRDGR